MTTCSPFWRSRLTSDCVPSPLSSSQPTGTSAVHSPCSTNRMVSKDEPFVDTT
jgi:hypothetical protein